MHPWLLRVAQEPESDILSLHSRMALFLIKAILQSANHRSRASNPAGWLKGIEPRPARRRHDGGLQTRMPRDGIGHHYLFRPAASLSNSFLPTRMNCHYRTMPLYSGASFFKWRTRHHGVIKVLASKNRCHYHGIMRSVITARISVQCVPHRHASGLLVRFHIWSQAGKSHSPRRSVRGTPRNRPTRTGRQQQGSEQTKGSSGARQPPSPGGRSGDEGATLYWLVNE